MTTATLSPFTSKDSTKIGKRTYRKQVLPLGTINYKGRVIKFDKEFLTDLAESFKKGAYDQVPFVLADEENRHTMDPERFRGEVKGFELSDDGLDAIVEFNEDGARVVEQNPKLGVSARIIEGIAKADGRTFKRGIQHVLGTMDPRVTGLRPWTAIDLAVYTADEQVVDLTAETYEKGNDMTAPAQAPEAAQTDQDQPLDLSGLSDEEFDALLQAAEENSDEPENDPEVVEGGEGEVTDKPDKPKEGTVQDVDLSEVADSDDDVTTNSNGQAVVQDNSATVDLANDVVTGNDRDEVQRMRIDLANEKWRNERRELVRSGVPPFILDLAEPVLASPDPAVIDLSTSDQPVDATKVIRDLVLGMKGMIDVTPEIGHSVDLSEDGSDSDAAALALWDQEYGKA